MPFPSIITVNQIKHSSSTYLMGMPEIICHAVEHCPCPFAFTRIHMNSLLIKSNFSLYCLTHPHNTPGNFDAFYTLTYTPMYKGTVTNKIKTDIKTLSAGSYTSLLHCMILIQFDFCLIFSYIHSIINLIHIAATRHTH